MYDHVLKCRAGLYGITGQRRHLPHEVIAFQGVPPEWLPSNLKDWTVAELQDIGGNAWCQVCKMLSLLATQTVDWETVQKEWGDVARPGDHDADMTAAEDWYERNGPFDTHL